MKKAFVLAIFIIFNTVCNAQEYSPLELTKRIFTKVPFVDLSKFITGEYVGHPNGNDLSGNNKLSFKLLSENDKTAVVAINISDTIGNEMDAYFHLKKDTVWKVEAFRALAMTGIVAQVHQELSVLTPQKIDSVISSRHSAKRDSRMFKTKEEYQFTLANTELTLASDRKLIEHFNNNKQAFENLKNDLIAKGIMSTTDGIKEMKNIDDIKKQINDLFLSGVRPDGESSIKNLNFLIGGILDNTVGYLYVKDKKDLPTMSPGRFIMIQEIGDGWYLYKTT